MIRTKNDIENKIRILTESKAELVKKEKELIRNYYLPFSEYDKTVTELKIVESKLELLEWLITP